MESGETSETSDDRLKNQTFELALSLSLSLGVKFQIIHSVRTKLIQFSFLTVRLS